MPRKSKAKERQAQEQEAFAGAADHSEGGKKVHFGGVEAAPAADGGASSDSEESSDEDDMGELITPEIDAGINRVLAALRSDDAALKDPTTTFFPEVGADGTAEARLRGVSARDKPLYLKDYHRENLLAGQGRDDEEEVAPDTRETYVQQQSREKAELLASINGEFGGDEDQENDDDDGFLVKRKEERAVEEAPLPDPEADPDAFLDAFVKNKAWVPKDVDAEGRKVVPRYEDVVQDEDSDEFDDIADTFESAYNFRYEDPEAAEIVSYARDQNTMRRKEGSGRRRQRDKKREEREAEENKRKAELARLRKKKVGDVQGKLERLQALLGDDDAINPEDIDLEGDWDDTEWDARMQKLFGEEFYAREDAKWKPKGKDGDNGDGDEIVDAGVGGEGDDTGDTEEAEGGEDVAEDAGEDAMDLDGGDGEAHAAGAGPALRDLSRKDLKRKAEEFVDANTDLLLDESFTPSSSFRYREVDAESFGLSARDILLADDKDLNTFVSLKHLASFRDAEKQGKDKKRFAKKRRLREWRKTVFGAEDGPDDAAWAKLQADEAAAAAAAEPSRKKAKPGTKEAKRAARAGKTKNKRR